MGLFGSGGFKKFGGRKVSRDTKRLAKKLMRGKGSNFANVGSRKQRKRAAVEQVYSMKRDQKFDTGRLSQQNADKEITALRKAKRGGSVYKGYARGGQLGQYD